MEIELVRNLFAKTFTLGELSIDGSFFCYTVEDTAIDWLKQAKIPGRTAVPQGRYRVVVTMSPRFKKPLPLLLDVPYFEGIRIHSGNTAMDSDGCILVGLRRSANGVVQSRDAMKKLMAVLDGQNEVWITIKEDRG